MADLSGAVEVYRSDVLYLVQRGGTGRLVDAESGTVSDPLPVPNILAHVPVSDPWELVPEGTELPEIVAATVGGWAMAAEPDPGPETSTRAEGPTPAGGAYAVAFWRDVKGDPCPQSEAVAVEIVEYDEDGNAIARTYADLKPSQPFYAKDDDVEA